MLVGLGQSPVSFLSSMLLLDRLSTGSHAQTDLPLALLGNRRAVK